MAASRAKRKVQEAREALYRGLVLEAAEHVFARKGYEDTKMEEVAQLSGISLGTLYTVFSGKAEIFTALHESGDEELLRCAVDAAQDVKDPEAALQAGVRAYARYFLAHPDFLRMHLREGFAWGSEEAGAGSRQRTEAWRAGVDMLATAVERCIEAGIFIDRDARLLARMMIAMQQVELAHWLEGGMRGDPERVVEDMEAQVARSFRKRGQDA